MTVDRSHLARLEKVELREVWPDEAATFTPWLAGREGLRLLGKALGIDLVDPEMETTVGSYSADIVATTADGSRVVIENQLGRTDHDHLGKSLTYAAGLDALTVVWIAKAFTDEHREALAWLNRHTSCEIAFFGLEIELWKIGDSPCAPRLHVVARPSEWVPRPPLSEVQRAQLDFWQGFRDHVGGLEARFTPTAPLPGHLMKMAIGKMGFGLNAVASTWNEDGSAEIRAEFVIATKDAQRTFENLKVDRREFDRILGRETTWYSEDGVRQCSIYYRKSVDWQSSAKRLECYEWLVAKLDRLHEVFRPRILDLP